MRTPIGSMYAIYGNIYHQYTPNVSIYTIHGSYGTVNYGLLFFNQLLLCGEYGEIITYNILEIFFLSFRGSLDISLATEWVTNGNALFSLEMGIELWVDSNIWGSFNLSLVTEDTQRIDADLKKWPWGIVSATHTRLFVLGFIGCCMEFTIFSLF